LFINFGEISSDLAHKHTQQLRHIAQTGPNASTFVIAEEVFPTKYSCTCQGFSAALGKLGSIMAQIFLTYAKFGGIGVNDEHSTWLGWILLIFTVWVISGAGITRFWVPNPSHSWGHRKP
jgi:PHS family inorganic phosphate transporter-like MFS transporter